ncbi:hypothetical protein GCM10010136_01600 [Limoniibacter endophyticus]|uniref:Uncharacterized protein n=1 Tax=Limoniibacter endophyticus TaxID=1565040 RepID=A0A8J3DKL2_9HYPH|nr:hypothetical protein GCM10010136_01600 [Limoniibacter endophyticus]
MKQGWNQANMVSLFSRTKENDTVMIILLASAMMIFMLIATAFSLHQDAQDNDIRHLENRFSMYRR